MRFGDKHWTDQLKQTARDFKFNATLKPRLDIEIKDWHASQPSTESRAVFTEGDRPDATPLGGPMSIRYEWPDESETDSTD